MIPVRISAPANAYLKNDTVRPLRLTFLHSVCVHLPPFVTNPTTHPTLAYMFHSILNISIKHSVDLVGKSSFPSS